MALRGAKGSVTLIDKATRPLKSIANAFVRVAKESNITNKAMIGSQKAINGISKAQSRLGRIQANNQRATRNIGSQAVGVAALALSFKAALQPAIRFEQSMKDLEAVAFGSADATIPVAQNMALLSEQAKTLGASTAFSASQAAEGQLFLAKAGFKTNQILSTMPSLLDLASASGTELGRTSDILSDLLGAFGLNAGQSGKLVDVMAAATSSANVDMETLFETLKVAAPIGIAAGQSMEGITTATALLGNVGIKGSMAGTALKNAFVNLASPATEGAKVLKELGIRTADASGNMLPMQDIMLSLGKSAKNLSQTKRIKAFDAVFGKIAMAGAINLSKAVSSGEFDKMLTNLQNSEGVAKKMALIRMDSTEGSITQLMSAVEGLAISFGTILTPILRGVASVLTQLTAPLQTFIKGNENLVTGIGIFAGVLLAAKVVALGYTASLWLISPAITALSVALTILKAPLLLFNLMMSANPVGAVVIAVTALAAAGIALYTNWDKVTSTFRELWDVISNFDFSDILGSFGNILDKVGLGNLFGGDAEITKNTTIAPQQALQTIQNNNTNNNPVSINMNIVDGKLKSVETQGTRKVDTFINDGSQF